MSHMLPMPFMHVPVSSADARKLLAEIERREREAGGATLHTVITHLLQLALVAMADRARGPEAAGARDFAVGSGLFAYDLAERALKDIEDDNLTPLCNLGEGSEEIYEEISSFGRRALRDGRLGEDGVFRF